MTKATKPPEAVNLDTYVLQALHGKSKPVRLAELTDDVRALLRTAAPEILKAERARSSDPGISIYGEVGASTQRLKHAGKLELVRGAGSGWRLIAIVLLAFGLTACGFSPFHASDDSPGPDAGAELDADAGGSDAFVQDAGCPGDLDCDGVPDAVDNCPAVANPDQHDEDGDVIGDACDPCPAYSDNTDSDHDGVGDLCDPHPSTPGDRIVAFAGFGNGVPAGWLAIGSWASSGDALTVNGGAATASLTRPAPSSKHETITASVTVVSVPQGNSSVISVADDYVPTTTDPGISCRLYSNGSTTPYLWLSIGTPSTLYQMTEGDTYVLSERRDGQSFGCHGERADNASINATTDQLTTSVDNAAPQIGLRIVGPSTIARFQWVMIVEGP